MIEVPDAFFLLIFKPHTLGDLLKINSKKKLLETIPLWSLGFRTRIFCLFLSCIHWVICSKLIRKKTTKIHPIKGFEVPGAVFLLIFKPHNSGDLLKINQKKISTNYKFVVIAIPDAFFLFI